MATDDIDSPAPFGAEGASGPADEAKPPPSMAPPTASAANEAWRERAKTPLWKRLLPFVVASALLVYVGLKIDFRRFGLALSNLNYVGYLAFVVVWTLTVCGGDTLGTVAAYRLTTPSVRYGQFYAMRSASYLPGVANHHLGQAFLTYLMSRLFKVPIRRMAGATLLSYASWVGSLLGCMVIALPFTNLSRIPVPIILGAGILYLVIIGLKPARLAKISFLAPLFEAGLKGHAVALGARLPHLAVLVLGGWVSLLFFHLDIPLTTALVYMPILLVVATLPIAPGGVGTRDTAAGVFFAAFAPGSTEPERLGNVAAATMSWAVSNTLMCAIMGLIGSRIVAKWLRQADIEEARAKAAGEIRDQEGKIDG
ncbi:MAG: hypothetical protein U0414_06160 [Polyangiaceae bacterium]